MGIVVLALSFCGCVGLVVLFAMRQTRWMRLPSRALCAGNPRRSRALARILARGAEPHQRAYLAMWEANALLWEGELARAMAVLDTRVRPARSLGTLPIIIRLECLLFDERIEEARQLFSAHADALRATRVGKGDVAAIAGFLRFYDGDLDGARTEIEKSFGDLPWGDPTRRAAHFCLAAIAHRQDREDDARRHLAQTIFGGGDLFIVRWATAQWDALFPRIAIPSGRAQARPQLRMPRLLTGLLANLWIGLNVLVFRTAALRGRTFTVDQVAALVMVNLLGCAALRFVDYTSDAHFFGSGLVAVTAPILLFLLTAHIATRRLADRDAALRLLTGFYASLPLVLAAAFISIRTHARYDDGPHAFEVVAGMWLLAMVMRLIHTVVPRAGAGRLVACAALFALTWLIPMHAVGGTTVFYAPMKKELADYEADQRRHDEIVFAEADKLQRAEAKLASERPGVSDLYFVGAAGWATQDVFGREVQSARQLFDDRFDTEGRSIVLANEPSPRDGVPLAASPTLRHVLEAVGKRMNREEDVLFLFVTSHGSNEGLALQPPRRGAFHSETLSPANLRSMLDSSGIKWRVLVISGCESGVFIGPLQNEFTLIATAAASDRESYGCAMGNPFTDFGRAVFGEQLVHERSFMTAFTNAATVIGRREADDKLLASRPQIAEGAAIREKLRDLEQRIAAKPAGNRSIEPVAYSQP